GATATTPQDAKDDEEIYYHDSGDLSAEDLEGKLAVLPEIPIWTTAKVSIEDLKVGDSGSATPEEIERLRQIIWKKRHLLIGKGNALPPAAKGVVCDIDVGNAKPIALRTRKLPTRFREKVAGLIKDLLAAEIIRPSTFPWASPIVIVRKSNVPLIGDLLEDLDKALWYRSLDMASGFWVVPMTDRAREISAFITPFGLFEWRHMPFGLKNAPQIYQRLVDNALYGFLKISRSGDAGATTNVFQTGIAYDPDRKSVLGRRSYMDDIMIAAESVAKRFWGMDKVGYLEHRVSIGGLETIPKDLKSLTDLPFPGSLRFMQSFLGSLNYYSRFIEDYAIYASVLYELRKVEFAELEKRSDLWEILDRNDPIPRDHDPPELKLTAPVDESRTLKTNESNYNVTEKVVLGLLRILDLYYNLLVGREIRVLTRHSTLAWLFKSTGLQGRLGQWSALLAPWTLEITKCMKGEDEILGAIAASITPRAKIDDALTEIAPRKEPKRRIQAPIPTVDRDEELWVISFDRSARVKCGGVASGALVWSLPGWEAVKARSGYLESLTVNEAEYNGLILGLDMLEDLDRKRLVVCGDSNLVIRQVRGEIDCKAPGLTLLKRKALDRLRKWSDHELVYVKRDWNGSADSLVSAALQRQGTENPLVRVAAVTTRSGRARSQAGVMQEDLIREIRVDRIKQAQEEEVWITGMKKYLSGSIADLTQAEARSYGKIAADYEVDEQDLLFYCPPPRRDRGTIAIDC
ncbi:reverse transcriptase, partial [Phytophthora megakarya]